MTSYVAVFHVFLFLAAGFVPLAWAVPPTTSYYWNTRSLICKDHGIGAARCSLRFPDSNVDQNPGCFEELDKNNITRVYCGLNCEESDEATLVTKTPSWNHECNGHFTYNIERRRLDWFLWRSGACTNTTITFAVRCGFFRDPRNFYREHHALFEYEDSE